MTRPTKLTAAQRGTRPDFTKPEIPTYAETYEGAAEYDEKQRIRIIAEREIRESWPDSFLADHFFVAWRLGGHVVTFSLFRGTGGEHVAVEVKADASEETIRIALLEATLAIVVKEHDEPLVFDPGVRFMVKGG